MLCHLHNPFKIEIHPQLIQRVQEFTVKQCQVSMYLPSAQIQIYRTISPLQISTQIPIMLLLQTPIGHTQIIWPASSQPAPNPDWTLNIKIKPRTTSHKHHQHQLNPNSNNPPTTISIKPSPPQSLVNLFFSQLKLNSPSKRNQLK